MYSVERYVEQLKALLPFGRLFESLTQPGKMFAGLLRGVATEFSTVDQRAVDLQREADPSDTLELLPNYLDACGLPDASVPVLPETADDRRALVLERFIGDSFDTAQALIDAAARLGFVVTLSEYRRFLAGSLAGAPLAGDARHFSITVNVDAPPPKRFKAGSLAGEPMRVFGFEQYLESALKALKPAHITIAFNYIGA